MTQGNNLARVTAGGQIYRRETQPAEYGRRYFKVSGHGQAVFYHGPRLFEIQRLQMIKYIDPVGKIRALFKKRSEFFLRKNYYLQQFAIVRFVVEKLPQYFQAAFADFLPFIDNQNNNFALVNAFGKKIIFYFFFQLPFALLVLAVFNSQHFAELLQKFDIVAE